MDIYIYGAGKYGKQCFEKLNSREYTVKGFVVTDKTNNPNEYMGCPVLDLEEYLNSDRSVMLILALKESFRLEVIKNLIEKGVSNYRIFNPKTIDLDFVLETNDNIRQVFDSGCNNGENEFRHCTIFASYSMEGIIPEYVIYHLKELRKISDKIIFVSDNSLKNSQEWKKIEKLVDHAEFFHHGGYDFGSYKIGYNYIIQNKLENEFDDFLFVNDSCYGPIFDLSKVYEKMNGYDFWGLVDSEDDVYHLLSFFINVSQKVFKSDLLRQFFATLPSNLSFWDAVNYGEKRFTKCLQKSFKSGCYIPRYCTDNSRSYSAGNRNGTVWPCSLIKDGFPYIKVKAATRSFGKDLRDSIADALLQIKNKNIELYTIIINDLYKRDSQNEILFDDKAKDISQILVGKKVISFDIFDTLLVRPFCEPTDLFSLIEKNEGLVDFYTERIKAEKKARKNSKYDEVTLEEIYSFMRPEFSSALQLELEYEFKLLKKNPLIQEIYKQAINSGLKIIATSDMYLSQDFLKSVLLKNGYTEVSEVYVSSQIKENKGSGKLYKYVLNDCGIKNSELLHIGDNSQADKVIPRSLGITAYNIETLIGRFDTPANIKWNEYYKNNKSLVSSVLYSLIARTNVREVEENTSYFEMLGYRLGGPLALSYLTFIIKTCEANSIDKILFVSRDGWILKELYSKFFYEKKKINYDYVYLQRIIGLCATLDYNNTPVYLKKLLEKAKEKDTSICVTDNYELNKLEFIKNIDIIKTISNEYQIELIKHIESCAETYKNIAIVDMTTGSFSSYKYGKYILADRLKLGIYSGCFTDDNDAIYSSFSKRLFIHEDDSLLQLSEILISSPENNVVALKGCKPVYIESDNSHELLYSQIAKGIIRFADDIIQLFGDKIENICFSKMDEWMVMADFFKKHLNHIDISELSKIYHSDLFRKEGNNSLKELLGK